MFCDKIKFYSSDWGVRIILRRQRRKVGASLAQLVSRVKEKASLVVKAWYLKYRRA